jgi:predicted enzyme related to lactoylglutathione lyase
MATSIPGTIDYVEIPSRDVAISREFFTQLLGWTFTDYGPDYTSFEDGRISGGFYKSDKSSRVEAGGALVVIYAESLERAKADVIRLGASITRDIFSFPGGRRFQFTEPGGSEFSIWSDK